MSRIVQFRALIAILSAGCYLRPAKTTGPLTTIEGVRVVLLGQDCEDHGGGGDDGPIGSDLALKLRLENPTGQTLEMDPKALLLSVDAETFVTADATTVETLQPGEARELRLHFMHHSLCEREFALTFDRALKLGKRPLQVATLRFTP